MKKVRVILKEDNLDPLNYIHAGEMPDDEEEDEDDDEDEEAGDA